MALEFTVVIKLETTYSSLYFVLLVFIMIRNIVSRFYCEIWTNEFRADYHTSKWSLWLYWRV